MSEEAIWAIINNNEPRSWEVYHEGRFWFRDVASSGQEALDSAFDYHAQCLIEQFYRNTSVSSSIEVRCPSTDERLKDKRCIRL